MMHLLSIDEISLPLRNPVIIFSLVLFIILFAPLLFNKVKLPHIIGLIIAGVIVGPHGFNLLRRDSSIVLFGTVGLLYIMFLAGLEIDMSEFRKNRNKILVFGLFTFLLPLTIGALAGYYLLGYTLTASVLLASMFSTHTLISYPIASRYGVTKNRAVTLTIGGTMITDILALLILAIIAGMSKQEVTSTFWIRLGISSIVYVGVVFFLFPLLIRWFFKHFDDSVSQYIFVLAIVFLSAFLAEAAGIEAIIGAFFAGLVLNKFIPHSSPLMNRIDFVGNALFIPFFLLSIGMLVDITVLSNGWPTLKVAGVIVIVAVLTKYIAAWMTQKVFRLSPNEGKMIFGLSTSHAAATLAIILVGYNIIIGETPSGEPVRLLGEEVMNGTILLILVSCAISSFVVERAARQLALEEQKSFAEAPGNAYNILISLSYPDSVTELVNFGLLLTQSQPSHSLLALHVVSDEQGETAPDSSGRKMLDMAVKQASAAGKALKPLHRHDAHISNGIIYTVKEQGITDLVLGLHQDASEEEFLGDTAERIVSRIYETIFIYRPKQPLNTLRRLVVVVPPNAEFEPGFGHWIRRIHLFSKESGCELAVYATPKTQAAFQNQVRHSGTELTVQLNTFENWDDFAFFSGILRPDDLFIIVASRDGHVSYSSAMQKLPYYLTRYFPGKGFIIVYPKQLEHGLKMDDVQHIDSTLVETLSQQVHKAGGFLKKRNR